MKPLDQKEIEKEIEKERDFIKSVNNNQFENDDCELELEFNFRRVTNEALNALKNNSNIRALGFHCCQNICDQDLEVLNTLCNMKKFYIYDSNCQGGFIRYLNENIQYLSCYYTTFELSNFKFFDRFSNLESLWLSFCDVNEESLKIFNESNLSKLYLLYIQGAQFSRKTIFCNDMQELELVSLSYSTGIKNISSFFKHTPNLIQLALFNTDIDDDSFAEIVDFDAVANINYLDLSKTKVTDRSLFVLSKSNLQSIESLYLNETEISEKGLSYFEGTPLSQSVTSLELNGVKKRIELDRILEIFPNLFLLDAPISWFNRRELIRNHPQEIIDSMNNRTKWDFTYQPNGREDPLLVTCRKKSYSHICDAYFSQQRRNGVDF